MYLEPDLCFGSELSAFASAKIKGLEVYGKICEKSVRSIEFVTELLLYDLEQVYILAFHRGLEYFGKFIFFVL